MSLASLTADGAVMISAAEGGGFHAPGTGSFQLPPVIDSVPWLTKFMLMATLSVILIAGFYLITSRRAAVVPSKGQFVGELAYNFVRNGIARDQIGSKDFLKFVPYLVALFSFVLLNNVFGVVPFLQIPTFSHIGWAMALTAVSYVVYIVVGVRKHGVGGFLKLMCWPSGVPGPIMILVVPLEFMSNLLVRPLTLCLRLFANMFAGHLVLLVFVLGGSYMLTQAEGLLLKPVGVIAYLMGILLMFLELLIQALQAYIFTVLTASYIAGSLADEH